MNIKKDIIKDSLMVKITVTEEGQEAGRCFVYILHNDLHAEPFAYLEDVFVAEKFRGQKIGTKLVELAVEEAKSRGCYKMIFTTRHAKPEVQEWYKKLGFKDWGTEFRMDLKSDSKILTKD
ncbi:MAG: GNAT family N-acetyltransferase [Candidatus Magasanikbacteria bacterium]|nr:GNAT family N-acetyltransferase [Candidatus Magasanikbacteria bacterium]